MFLRTFSHENCSGCWKSVKTKNIRYIPVFFILIIDYIVLFWFQAEENLKKYGKMFMAERPEETTELLKRLCTDYKPTDS